jgi:hypothetical protein
MERWLPKLGRDCRLLNKQGGLVASEPSTTSVVRAIMFLTDHLVTHSSVKESNRPTAHQGN